MIVKVDANSKLGPNYIPNDSHEMSPNGKVLSEIIKRYALIMANGSERCRGLLTRQKNMTNRWEKSWIDLVMLSSDLSEELQSHEIDEQQTHVLTRITNTKKGVIIKMSDHNILITELKCEHKTHKKKDKVEVYNLKNTSCIRSLKNIHLKPTCCQIFLIQIKTLIF